MFGWFKPSCPVGTWEKAWIEVQFAALVELVGLPRLLAVEMLLPTREYFPDALTPPPHDANTFLANVRNYLQLDVGDVGLRILDEERQVWDATREDVLWDEPVVRIAQSALHDAEALVSAIACELSRIYLAQRGVYSERDADALWAAELLAVVLGAGVFVANAAIVEEPVDSTSLWRSSQMRRRGYLPARMVGYALALFAWAREERPTWSTYLRLDAASAARDGWRYLRSTRDSLFTPGLASVASAERPIDALLNDLARGTPARRLAALWSIGEQAESASSAHDAVIAGAGDDDVAVRDEALRVLTVLGVQSSAAEEAVLRGLRDESESVRATAAHAAASLFPESSALIEELSFLLEDESGEVTCGAALALGRYGRRAAPHLDRMLNTLKRGIVTCHEPITAAACGALLAIAADPTLCICQRFGEDPEMLDTAIRELRKYGPSDEPAID
ncbi:MAG: HEAT repeat domain-containing protein [Pirellulaceae bacterium]